MPSLFSALNLLVSTWMRPHSPTAFDRSVMLAYSSLQPPKKRNSVISVAASAGAEPRTTVSSSEAESSVFIFMGSLLATGHGNALHDVALEHDVENEHRGAGEYSRGHQEAEPLGHGEVALQRTEA